MRNRQYDPVHYLGDDQFHSGLSHIPPLSPVRARIRRQRHRADRAVDTRHDRGYDLSVRRDLLYDVPDQRYIRICQLAQNAKKTGDGLCGITFFQSYFTRSYVNSFVKKQNLSYRKSSRRPSGAFIS